MAFNRSAALILACLVLSTIFVAALAEKRILVILDRHSLKDSHSVFFSYLKDQGFQLKYALADSPSLSLSKFGESIYDHIIIFAPTVESFGGSLASDDAIVDFFDQGGSVLLAVNSEVTSKIQDLVKEFGFESDGTSTSVIDHFNHEGSDATLVKASNVIKNPLIVGNSNAGPLLFRGVSLSQDKSNPLSFPVLSASSTAYSADPHSEIDSFPHTIGSQTVLIGALQGRNSARVVISGSLDFFSNELFALSKANQDVAQNLALWTFKERGVLRLGTPHHHKVGETVQPAEYTITDDVHFEVNLEEKVNGKWVPFQGKDVQLEFVRIDPFVRITLKNTNGLLHSDFKLPDVYGVFQFKIDYRRIGYTNIHSTTQVSVRPFWHTQYERFIVSAYPYYAGVFSMMFGLFVFSFVFLHHRDKAKVD